MPDISEKERKLIELETYLNCRLPEDYRDFLLFYEGAAFEKNCLPQYTVWLEEPTLLETLRFTGKNGEVFDYPIWDYQIFYQFNGPLFWLTDDEDFSVLQRNKEWRKYFVEDSWFPEGKDYVVFAEDGNSNYFCMGIRGKDRGNIYFWSHEEAWSDQYKPSARSFTEFLSLLRKEEDADIPEEKYPRKDDASH
jgi:hypothetical protein